MFKKCFVYRHRYKFHWHAINDEAYQSSYLNFWRTRFVTRPPTLRALLDKQVKGLSINTRIFPGVTTVVRVCTRLRQLIQIQLQLTCVEAGGKLKSIILVIIAGLDQFDKIRVWETRLTEEM